MAFVYTGELYPSQVSALGIGYVNIMGMSPNIFLPSFIDYLNKQGFPVMVIFGICAALAIVAVFFLRETFGKHPPEII